MPHHEAEQYVLPGMQGDLRIGRNVEKIPASHVENLTATKRTFTVDDVKRVIVDLGIYSEDRVDQAIIKYRREYLAPSDAEVGTWMILIAGEEIGKRFESQFGVPLNIESLCIKGFCGVFLDEEGANLPRTPEEQELDQQRIEELGGYRTLPLLSPKLFNPQR